MNRPVIYFIHGFCRSRFSMARLAWRFRAAGYQVFLVPYNSLAAGIPQLAETLKTYIEQNQKVCGDPPFHLVGHSLGGILARYYAGHFPSPQLRRIVMIAPPNRPSLLASLLRRTWWFRLLGPAGQQLGDNDFYRKHLPRCNHEIGVVAGSAGRASGYNPLLKGENDLIVTLEDTRLEEMQDWISVPHLHTWIMHFRDTFSCARMFLENGKFR